MTTKASQRPELLAKAAELHSRITTFDGHVDIPLNFGSPGYEPDRDGPMRFDLPKVARGRLSGASLVVAAAAARPTPENLARLRNDQETRFRLITGLAETFPTQVGIARSPDEFRNLVHGRKFAIVLSFQNASSLAPHPESIDPWIARGVRMFALTFIGNNPWADSARPYPFVAAGNRSDGLSDLGRAAVRRLNDLGAIVDVSQLSAAALDDVLATSRAPIVASHSALSAFVDTGRNLGDADLAKIKSRGGLVQIVGFAPYLLAPDATMMEALRATWRRYGLPAPQTVGAALSVDDPETADWPEDKFWTFLHEFHDVLKLDEPVANLGRYGEVMDYAVERIGIDHVGVASDFNHSGGLADWKDVGQSLAVTAELLSRGYDDADIARIWGENFLRVWQVVQDAAD
jgi:microsomal dipeptidase-like Zn-dependent dipeptidase